MTEIVVASIGGSGSRLMAQMLSDATGRPRCNDEFDGDWHGHILHTHRPYHEERDKIGSDFKAVFMLGHIGDAICSFYEERIDIVVGMRLMGVSQDVIDEFVERKERDIDDAWMYLIKDDKLRWRDNILSWISAPNTMIVYYEALCVYPVNICYLVGKHVGFSVEFPSIKRRISEYMRLPYSIRRAINYEYIDFTVINDIIKFYKDKVEN